MTNRRNEQITKWCKILKEKYYFHFITKLRSWCISRGLWGWNTASITIYCCCVGTIWIVTARIYTFTISYVILLLQTFLIALNECIDNKFDGDFVNSFHVVRVAIAQCWWNCCEKRLFDFLFSGGEKEEKKQK